ncbi:hypothetical protein V2J09_003526 [Rumex salicifolius]
MERDFMGLNSKEPMASVKREITDEGPKAHWPFMKNSSSHPNFMSFGDAPSQDDGMKKMNPPLPLSNSPLKPNFTSYGQNVNGATMSQQFLGIPMTVSSPVGSFVGFTDPWNTKKSPASPAAPAQMTIFYAGSVSVYEGITPEKAQAIMLLAGNGSSPAPNMNLARPPMLLPFRVSTTVTDTMVPNQPLTSQPGPTLTNHSSLSSHPVLQSGSGKDVQTVNNGTGISSSTLSKPEPQRMVSPSRPIPMSVLTPSAVPQFRKASLARFLEKRKERVVSVVPYSCDKKPQEIPGNNNLGSASNSAANSMTSP